MTNKTMYWVGGITLVFLGVYVFMPSVLTGQSRFGKWKNRNVALKGANREYEGSSDYFIPKTPIANSK